MSTHSGVNEVIIDLQNITTELFGYKGLLHMCKRENRWLAVLDLQVYDFSKTDYLTVKSKDCIHHRTKS